MESPGTGEKARKVMGATGAGRRTIAEHGPAVESGEVICEIG